jgi:hypothetical protein
LRTLKGLFHFLGLKKEAYILYAYSFNKAKVEKKGQAKVSMDIKLLTISDFLSVNEIFRRITPDFELKFQMGDLCFGAIVDNVYVQLNWVTRRDFYINEIEREIKVPLDAAYIFGTYCLPKYRNLGINTETMNRIGAYLTKFGMKNYYLLVSKDNNLMRGIQEKHSRRVGAINYYKIFNQKYYRYRFNTKTDRQELLTLFPNKKPQV